MLSADIRRKKRKSEFSKLRNKQGGYRRGMYKVRRKQSNGKPERLIEEPTSPSSNFIGSAGEHAVIGELLFRGYNAAIMTVDEGLDIVSSKANSVFWIQVKTATSSGGSYSFTIKKKTFEQHAKALTFYVLLCRSFKQSHYHHDYIIFPSATISHFIECGAIKNKDTISIRVNLINGKYILNKETDIDGYVNKFELIK